MGYILDPTVLVEETAPAIADRMRVDASIWPESPARARNPSKDLPPPPIVELLTKKPWLLASLYTGRIPHESSVASC